MLLQSIPCGHQITLHQLFSNAFAGYAIYLECRKWGLKRWGLREIRGFLRKKGLFPPFSGFPRCSSHPPENCEKRQKKGERGRFRPISRNGGQTPLKPPFVTPPFAAAQFMFTLQNWFRINHVDNFGLNGVLGDSSLSGVVPSCDSAAQCSATPALVAATPPRHQNF